MGDKIDISVVTIDAVNEKIGKIVEEIRHNGHLIRVNYIAITNASNSIMSHNAAISLLMEKNAEMSDEIVGLQMVLDKVSRERGDTYE